MEIFGIALLVGAFTGWIGFMLGEYHGDLTARKRHVNAFKESMETWFEAQKEAGVTPEQILKINEILTREVLKEFKEVFKGLK